MHQNDKNTLIWIKDTKTLRASPMKGKHQKHPSADQKLPRKLPREFKSSTKSLVKQSIMEGFPASPRHKSNPLVSCEENFPVEFMKPPRGQNQHKIPKEPRRRRRIFPNGPYTIKDFLVSQSPPNFSVSYLPQ